MNGTRKHHETPVSDYSVDITFLTSWYNNIISKDSRTRGFKEATNCIIQVKFESVFIPSTYVFLFWIFNLDIYCNATSPQPIFFILFSFLFLGH